MYVAFQILCSSAAICCERFLCQIPQCVGQLDKRQAQTTFIDEAGIKKHYIYQIIRLHSTAAQRNCSNYSQKRHCKCFNALDNVCNINTDHSISFQKHLIVVPRSLLCTH